MIIQKINPIEAASIAGLINIYRFRICDIILDAFRILARETGAKEVWNDRHDYSLNTEGNLHNPIYIHFIFTLQSCYYCLILCLRK